ncbi:MAG: hypothetical protein GY923_10525 [Aestuariibacter sp.]|uniref:hypothetical protein n=1 Tax=Marisediminitalea aggregata TaxID=634436 RepID=UPI0012A1F87F|nr:hypothetical protein [Marisediminitalea aggregata]MCP3865236.1 hypothetical protein [Aestuariibacter sp.]BBO29544.1 hypothetical protein AltI4_39320 [Alteromonas sp. I4]MCP4525195.1 hypothetical protein [Aestuariibacter sp.]MCP4947929.1 hypothetical protein [Aestuariibacter sp.]MCP9477815.1 hypothetical protein [Marisediminitalea aggregata]
MTTDEDKLKAMFQASQPEINQQIALKKVLAKSHKVTAVKDVAGLFVGWIWVVFLGFGASMYSARRQLNKHNRPLRKTPIKNSAQAGDTE